MLKNIRFLIMTGVFGGFSLSHSMDTDSKLSKVVDTIEERIKRGKYPHIIILENIAKRARDDVVNHGPEDDKESIQRLQKAEKDLLNAKVEEAEKILRKSEDKEVKLPTRKA